MDSAPGHADDPGRPPTEPAGGRAVFVLGTSTTGQQGPVASWLSTAGWAAAAERVLGEAWVLTREGPLTVDELRARATAPSLRSPDSRTWRRRVPGIAKTAAKDVRSWRRGRSFTIDPTGPWADPRPTFVWQRHDLFTTAGLELARALGSPSVLFAPATLVWEAEQWGVRRPGWSSMVERFGERPALSGADLVAAGSEPVAEQAVRLGADPARVLIVPTGVDPASLTGAVAGGSAHPDLADRFVVGWVGSFRGFHALERLVDAMADLPGTTLLLIGDGPERATIEARAAARGVAVRATGTVPHAELGRHLAAMDVAAVVADAGAPFHYSPLKLAEYLAAGLPVVVPAVPTITERVAEGRDALIVPPGDTGALRDALRRLRDDPVLRERLAAGASATAASFSWDAQVARVRDALLDLPARSRTGGSR